MDDCVSDTIELIYDAATEPQLWPATLQSIADCFNDVGAALVYGKSDGAFGLITSATLVSAIQEYNETQANRDIRALRGRERGYLLSGEVVTDRDVVSAAEMDTDPHYQFLAKYGLRYFVGASVSPDPRVEVIISVQRAIGKPEYNEQEMALLTRLSRHIERSLRLSMRLFGAELARDGLGTTLEHVGLGVLLLDADLGVVFANSRVPRWSRDGLRILDRRLVLDSSQALRDLRAAASRIAQDKTADISPVLMGRPGNRRALVLHVLPIATVAVAATELCTEARLALLIVDPDENPGIDPALIRDLLGLTLAEAKLVSFIAAGLSPSEAAEKLGISGETARTVLKRIFSKVGVSKQNELSILLNKMAMNF